MPELIIVGTPIGNLEDISYRALRILKEVDNIICEDKRVTLKIINHFDLGNKNLFTYNQASAERKLESAFNFILNNEKTIIVTDAGMPIVSDPGNLLVKRCYENNVKVDIIPGPSAPISALAASGLPGSKFVFLGFLPRDKNRRRLFRTLVEEEKILIFFESPNRILKTLIDINEILGNREIFIAREMTKIHQEFLKGNTCDIIEKLKKVDNIRGEFTVVISGK
ncbi:MULTISPECIES: 16S rRNA (cytidine(1402)-2'-O)-methyltransferase [Oceanotoga]|jgi:16S rRNA (cytidine1402-2'-O)-methyltransferase|uniref:Ribosomal RNA small subunit methyltransferase I n=1 Tax=Oceanotoga teriensis TaxID=515440 RepID=A0AA45C4N6_9BACT|nr:MULTISPECIES: 16S rRNA (cytidine(1402)-2'-O)-methyltransferase [Oceanotoga]MDN5341856.1 rRNA (cytidine1402-2-O)-methyltransferase [Oceanotoga sp.]MDO7976663.1 16S rRNA (cytidine(1402)-2'-O)-methyltransferase [Oceanotoga teriensis]PWJ87007.1 16S rRNA (cytidine1402-2'-O)-methyltransferase [Oceanotoga teriensis]